MKKILISLVMMMCFLLTNASSHHVYFEMHNDGTLNEVHYADSHNNYYIDVLEFIIAENGYLGITIKFQSVPAEYEVYRLHANGEHYASDETDPLWNMELQPTINPTWCSYSYENGVITFTDTFDSDILREELSTVNSVRYRIYDKTNNHDYTIQFNNVFTPIDHGIITSVCKVSSDKSEVRYYDLNGCTSSMPFNGMNIVVENGRSYKKIF